MEQIKEEEELDEEDEMIDDEDEEDEWAKPDEEECLKPLTEWLKQEKTADEEGEEEEEEDEDEDETDEEELAVELGETDKRIIKLFRLERLMQDILVEQWQAMMESEDYQPCILEFLDKKNVNELIIQYQGPVLMAFNSFSISEMRPFSFYVKKEPVAITEANMDEIIIFNNSPADFFQYMAQFFEQVIYPTLRYREFRYGYGMHIPKIVQDRILRRILRCVVKAKLISSVISDNIQLPAHPYPDKLNHMLAKIRRLKGVDDHPNRPWSPEFFSLSPALREDEIGTESMLSSSSADEMEIKDGWKMEIRGWEPEVEEQEPEENRRKPDGDRRKPDVEQRKPEEERRIFEIDLRKPDGDRLKPGGDRRIFEIDLRKPDGDRLKPGGDRRILEIDLWKPDGDRRILEIDLRKPDGDRLKPGGDRRILEIDLRKPPDGYRRTPKVERRKPKGDRQKPDGDRQKPAYTEVSSSSSSSFVSI